MHLRLPHHSQSEPQAIFGIHSGQMKRTALGMCKSSSTLSQLVLCKCAPRCPATLNADWMLRLNVLVAPCFNCTGAHKLCLCLQEAPEAAPRPAGETEAAVKSSGGSDNSLSHTASTAGAAEMAKFGAAKERKHSREAGIALFKR